MIDMAVGIHPYHSVTTAWCRCGIRLSGASGGGGCAGLAVGFGLNSEPIENGLAGDADAAGAAVGDALAFLRA